ncbi:MAG: TA system VapC family ribonuclease toxin [Chromatiales bacterium]
MNVLVAVSRSDHPHHRQALAWMNEALAACIAGATLHVLPMIAASFLRLVTHPKVFNHPTPIKDAVRFLDALLAAPGVEMPELGREWTAFRQLCQHRGLSGNAIPDAWIAAAVRANGENLVTFDRDFVTLLDKHDLTVLAIT